MKERNYSYDYLRAFSAIMIVFCHIFQGFGICDEIGYYLGGTYVDVFLLLSAYLLGLSSKDMINQTPSLFFKKRVGRLIPTYYTFLTLTFIIIILILGWDALTPKQIVGHYLFLNWFIESTRIYHYPLPQLGHLWFMSCIMFGYLFIMLWAKLANKITFIKSDKCWIIFFVCTSIVASVLICKIRFLVYPFTVILAFTILFFKGNIIMDWLHSLKSSLLVFLLVIGNIIGIGYYLAGGYKYPVWIFWINLLNACLWIACTPIIFKKNVVRRVILFLSSISFEIYLLHHPLCLGKYSLINYMPVWCAAVCVFIIAISGGWILSRITKIVINYTHIIMGKY